MIIVVSTDEWIQVVLVKLDVVVVTPLFGPGGTFQSQITMFGVMTVVIEAIVLFMTKPYTKRCVVETIVIIW